MTKEEIRQALDSGETIRLFKNIKESGLYYFGKDNAKGEPYNTIMSDVFNEFWEKVCQELGITNLSKEDIAKINAKEIKVVEYADCPLQESEYDRCKIIGEDWSCPVREMRNESLPPNCPLRVGSIVVSLKAD